MLNGVLAEAAEMGTVPFNQLPIIVRVGLGVAFNNAWWSIEEFVIDRHSLWRYMPYYRVADPCVWDLAVALITIVGLWWLSRKKGERQALNNGA